MFVAFMALTASAGAAPSATRDLPSDCVNPNSVFTVTIAASDFGTFGEVSETLCDGWTYTGTSLEPSQVVVDGNTVKFYLLGDTTFTYTVQAPSTQGECCTISAGAVSTKRNS